MSQPNSIELPPQDSNPRFGADPDFWLDDRAFDKQVDLFSNLFNQFFPKGIEAEVKPARSDAISSTVITGTRRAPSAAPPRAGLAVSTPRTGQGEAERPTTRVRVGCTTAASNALPVERSSPHPVNVTTSNSTMIGPWVPPILSKQTQPSAPSHIASRTTISRMPMLAAQSAPVTHTVQPEFHASAGPATAIGPASQAALAIPPSENGRSEVIRVPLGKDRQGNLVYGVLRPNVTRR